TLGGLPFPPRNLASEIALAVTEPAPFELKVEGVPKVLTPGGKEKVKVTATRLADYDGPIAVEFKNLPPNVTGGKGVIAKGQTEVVLDLTPAANAPAGDFQGVTISGTATALGNRQGSSLPFTLSI